MSVGAPSAPYTGEGGGYVPKLTDINAGSAVNIASVTYVPDPADELGSIDTTGAGETKPLNPRDDTPPSELR